MKIIQNPYTFAYQKEMEYKKRNPIDVQKELGLCNVNENYKPSFMLYVIAKVLLECK